MTDTEVFGIEKYDILLGDKTSDFGDFFTVLTNLSDEKILFCGIRTATADIDNIPEYLSLIKKTADEYNAYIICINEENITGYEHIESAVFHAKRSWFDEKPISNSFEMEVLLYAAGTRQCSLGAKFGLKKGKNSLYICVCVMENNKKKEDEDNLKDKEKSEKFFIIKDIFEKLKNIFEFSQNFEGENNKAELKNTELKKNKIPDEKMKRLMKIFEISEKETESVGKERFTELVLERVALLDVSK